MFIRWMLLRLKGRDDLPTVLINLLEFLLYFIILSVFFTVGLKFTEDISWNEAIWQVWQTATTVGYGNKPAVTLAGRNITMFFGIIGVAILGVIISSSIELKLLLSDRRRFGRMKNPYKDGYIIFNYPGEKIALFIKEIISLEPSVGICIIDSRLEELPSAVTSLYNKIHFVRGYSHDRLTYEKAAVQDNKKVIIFPLNPSSPESDLSTASLVDLVLRFVSKSTEVIYILIDPKNEWMFNKKGIPVLQNLEMLAAVQECQDPYSSSIVQKILSNIDGANVQTVLPTLTVGKTWGTIVEKSVLVSKKLKMPFNLLALIDEINIDPCPDTLKVIEKGNRLSIIADKNFNWNIFEKELDSL